MLPLETTAPQDALHLDQVQAWLLATDPAGVLHHRYHSENGQVYAITWFGQPAVLKIAGRGREWGGRTEVSVLAALATRRFPVPRVLWSSVDPGIHGQPALVMERFPALAKESLTFAQHRAVMRRTGTFIAELAQLTPAPDLGLPDPKAPEPLAGWYARVERRSLEHFAGRADIQAFWQRFWHRHRAVPKVIGQPQAGEILTDGHDFLVVDWTEGLTWIDPLNPIVRSIFWPLIESPQTGREQLDALLAGFRQAGGGDVHPDDPAIRLWLAFICLGDGLFLLDRRHNRILDEQWADWLRQLLDPGASQVRDMP